MLYSIKDKKKDINIDAQYNNEGNLQIIGQDLSNDLDKIFGEDISEYEWIIIINKKDFRLINNALNYSISEDCLKIIRNNFSNVKALKFESFCKENNIPYKFNNRFGN